ncbi:uncharacterized protein LOC115880172 [Sitophilus oryzae]|uniref:Uncharacterized protein LOC115880172 n=1 Tax=Sitophilus oryzae TaxID=7048 RepID=A0A6J2XNR9_SITOR|nr:uncharacterized protein LOC115880172 [Sitophilus oryzae]
MAGYDWYKSFLIRNPILSQRRSQNLNPARAQKLNPFITIDHFNKLENILRALDIKNSPERIFNIDEKGCRLTLHHGQRVLAKKGSRRVHLISNEHAENCTIVACVSALGHAVPPLIIFMGSRLKESYKEHLPPGSAVAMAEKGSMNREIFVQWLHHFSKFKPAGRILLILDGASCHLDISIVDAAENFEMSLYCLPSNTTHELQPLDKAVFRAFEHYWDSELLRYWKDNPTNLRSIKKENFGKILNLTSLPVTQLATSTDAWSSNQPATQPTGQQTSNLVIQPYSQISYHSVTGQDEISKKMTNLLPTPDFSIKNN